MFLVNPRQNIISMSQLPGNFISTLYAISSVICVTDPGGRIILDQSYTLYMINLVSSFPLDHFTISYTNLSTTEELYLNFICNFIGDMCDWSGGKDNTWSIIKTVYDWSSIILTPGSFQYVIKSYYRETLSLLYM